MNSTRFTVYRLSALELKKKAELADSLDSYVALTDELIVNLVSMSKRWKRNRHGYMNLKTMGRLLMSYR